MTSSRGLPLTKYTVKANISEDPKTKLNDKEMASQMSGLTLAGHDTTAGTLTWMLWELAKHPEYQDLMRSEILATKARVIQRGDTAFSMDDLDSMKYTVAAIKVRHRPPSNVSAESHARGRSGNTEISSYRLQSLERGRPR